MAKQLLISDDEERYLDELLHANLKGLDIHDVMHGQPCAMSIDTRKRIVGLLKKLGIEAPEPAHPGVEVQMSAEAPSNVLDAEQPAMDFARQLQQQLKPMYRDMVPSRLERIAGPIFVRRIADALPSKRDNREYVRSLAELSIAQAKHFFRALERNDTDGE